MVHIGADAHHEPLLLCVTHRAHALRARRPHVRRAKRGVDPLEHERKRLRLERLDAARLGERLLDHAAPPRALAHPLAGAKVGRRLAHLAVRRLERRLHGVV
eukprot:2802377-Prymnesium_polylepis.1